MKYVDEFRDKEDVLRRADGIRRLIPRDREVRIMEVCGTHTHAVCRFGLKKLFPDNLRLIAGPGCPVCVSDQSYIDSALALAASAGTVVATFGDMLRVPGTHGSLDQARSAGADVRIVYSPLEAIALARQNPRSRVVFLAIGFETTAAAIALTVARAREENARNLFFLTALKTMPAAMGELLRDERTAIDGFLCPGHVSAIIGSDAYSFIPRRFGVGCCVAGFEPADIMDGVYRLIRQMARGKPAVENQYSRVVSARGNRAAQQAIAAVFSPGDALWRGLGRIPKSGLILRKSFASFDAAQFRAKVPRPRGSRPAVRRSPQSGRARVATCRCGDVLKGILAPQECPLFRVVCRPENPVGPCMVSQEGACHAHYLYQ